MEKNLFPYLVGSCKYYSQMHSFPLTPAPGISVSTHHKHIVKGEGGESALVPGSPLVSAVTGKRREMLRGYIHKFSTEKSEFKHSSSPENYFPSKDSIWSSFGPYFSGDDNTGLPVLGEHSTPTTTQGYTTKYP